MAYLGGIVMFLSNENKQQRDRGFVRILIWCLIMVGLALILFIIAGSESAEAGTLVPGGPVSDQIYTGGWSSSGSPYYIQGDIWVPNAPSPPNNQLTIDGGSGPVQIIFNGSFSLNVGVSGAVDDATLIVMGSNKNILFTRNTPANSWEGIIFNNSASASSSIDNAIIEYTFGGSDRAVLIDGASGISITNNEIRFVKGNSNPTAIALGDATGITQTNNNDISENFIHNVTEPTPSTASTYGISLQTANQNTINNNTIENISSIGGGTAFGIYLWNSSQNTVDPNIVRNIQSSGGPAVGIELYEDCDDNDILDNQISNVRSTAPTSFDAKGIFVHSDSPLVPDGNLVSGNTVFDIFSENDAAAGIAVWAGGVQNIVKGNTITLIGSSASGGDALGIDIYNAPTAKVEFNDVSYITVNSQEFAYGISIGASDWAYIGNNSVFMVSSNGTAVGLFKDVTVNATFYNITVENITGNFSINMYCAVGLYSHWSINNTFEEIKIRNITGLVSDTAGLVLEGTTNEMFISLTISGVSAFGNNAFGIYLMGDAQSTFNDVLVENIIAQNQAAAGIVTWGNTQERYETVSVNVVRGSQAFGFDLSATVEIEIVSLNLVGVTGDSGNATGIRQSVDCMDTHIFNSSIRDVSTETQDASAMGIHDANTYFDIFINLEIENITSVNGSAFGIFMEESREANIKDSRIFNITADSTFASGMFLTSTSADCNLTNNTIYNITNSQNAVGVLIGNETNNTKVDKNTIYGVLSTDGNVIGIMLDNTPKVEISENTIELADMVINENNLAIGAMYDKTQTLPPLDVTIARNWLFGPGYATGLGGGALLRRGVGILAYPIEGIKIEGNHIQGIVHGMVIKGDTMAIVGNNTIFECENGIYMENGSYAVFYNNEIYDNLDWGIIMDLSSLGLWIIDDFGLLMNNPAKFNGTVRIDSGKLTLYNISTSSFGNFAVKGGVMELGASPNTLITQSVWVDSLLYINSSKWEINVTSNGEFGIQVNGTGTMIIQDNGTGASTVTDGPYDNDAGTLGVDDFRYYFRVLMGATFRLTESEVSEVGWEDVFENSSLYIAAMDTVYIADSTITKGYCGIFILEGGFTFENNVINLVDVHGMYVMGSLGTYISNNTIETNQDLGYGVNLTGTAHQIINNTIITRGASSHAIYGSTAMSVNMIDNKITTYGSSSHGIYLFGSGTNTLDKNDIRLSMSDSIGIFLDGCMSTGIFNNTISNGGGGIRISGSSEIDAVNNTITGAQTGVIVTTFSDTVTLSLNNISECGGGISIVQDSSGNFVINNDIINNTNSGISLSGVSGNELASNTISQNGFGILSTGSGTNIIRDNDIFQNNYGIWVVSNSVVNLFNNNIYDNPIWGIFTDPSSLGTWIIDGPALFENNIGLFNGPLTVGTNGEMFINLAELQVHNVQVDGGGSLEVLDSKGTMISQNLSISGTTILNNSSWEINSTFDGEHWIIVQPTGNLEVVNDSLITTYDPMYRYDFWVNGTANFLDSTIEYAGYSDENGSNGVRVSVDNVVFDNMVFRYCYAGIKVNASQPAINNILILNSTMGIWLEDGDTLAITNITYLDADIPLNDFGAGIVAMFYDNLTLTDIYVDGRSEDAKGILIRFSQNTFISNAFTYNISDGINIEGSTAAVSDSESRFNKFGMMSIYGSYVTFLNCEASNNTQVGILFYYGSGTVEDSIILSNNLIGIGVRNATPEIHSSTIGGPDQMVGFECDEEGSPFVVNSTIFSDISDFRMDNNSHPVSLNCTFDNSTTQFIDGLSTLTVQWFLHVRVEDPGLNPLPSVNVNIKDNANGAFESSFSTDASGYVRWTVITEYIENSTSWSYLSPHDISAFNATHYGIKTQNIWQSMVVVITLDQEVQLTVGKMADNTTLPVGEFITYTIWYDYTGFLNITNIFINDTLHPYLMYISDTSGITPVVQGPAYSWKFAELAPGNHSFELVVQVRGPITNGTLVSNEFAVDYSDFNNIPQPQQLSNSVSSTILAAEMTIEKSVENQTMDLGGYNTYTIWYNNTGGAAAQIVWINDTFHNNLTIISNSDLANWMGSGWEIGNVAPGSYMITVVVQLDSWDGLYGLLIPNSAGLEFTDLDGSQKPSLPPRYANFSVVVPAAVDYIRLEYSDGTLISPGTLLSADDEITVYARAYNSTTGLIGNISVTWSVNNGIGVLNTSVGPSITFFATKMGTGNISAIYGLFENATGELTVEPGAVVDIRIIPPGPKTYTADDTFVYEVRGYDSDGNLNLTWTPVWDWVGAGLGDMTMFTPDGYNYSMEFNITGSDFISVRVQNAPSIFNTSQVTVIPGRVVTIIITPAGSETNTTDEVLNFTISGYDANGNLNTTWTPDVNWTGPDLGAITINGYTVSVEYITVGSSILNISVSSDPSIFNISKGITVNPGAPDKIIYISGRDQVGIPKFPLANPFIVRVEDADSNPVPGVDIQWVIDGWPLGATGYSLSSTISTTDINGEAETVLTLGNTPGVYFVNATNATLTLQGEPISFNGTGVSFTIDEIIIGDALKNPISEITATTDDTITLYAWAYNKTAGVFGQINVNWSSLGEIGIFTTSTILQSQVSLDPTNVTTGSIQIEFLNATLNLNNATGVITITSGSVKRIEISPWPSTTATTDDLDAFSVLGYDADGNENWSWVPSWSWNVVELGPLTQVTLYNYTVDYNTTGVDIITVNVLGDLTKFNFTQVTVTAGAVNSIEITPWPSTQATTDDVGSFSVIGYDSDGNANWLWTPDWTWEGTTLGPFTQITSYNYTVDYDNIGSGKINVSVSGNPTVTITVDVTIDVGSVITIEIAPWPSVDNNTGESVDFTAMGRDAAGFANWSWTPNWSWDGAGLGTLTQITIYNYSVTFATAGSDIINVSLPGTSAIYNTTSVTVTEIMTQPTIDYIVIMDAPGGSGNPITARDFIVGQTGIFYAVGFNFTDGYVSYVDVLWSINNNQVGVIASGPSSFAVFEANLTNGGEFVITARNSSLPQPSNTTATLTVIEPNVDVIVIRTAQNGQGTNISSISLNGGEEREYFAAGYNETTGFYVSDIAVIWNITGFSGSIDVNFGFSTNFTASNAIGIVAQDTLTAVFNLYGTDVPITVNLPPSPPSNFKINQVPEGSSLELTWNQNPETDITGYLIFRSETSGTGYTNVGTVDGAETTRFVDTNLEDGKTYYYYIQAHDAGPNYSPNSVEISAMSDVDTDGDGLYNQEDPDDDNDGLSDAEELSEGEDGYITDPLDADSDNDGYDDLVDAYPLDDAKWEKKGQVEPAQFPWLILVIILIVVVILILMLMTKRKKSEEDTLLDEVEIPQGVSVFDEDSELLSEDELEDIPEEEREEGPIRTEIDEYEEDEYKDEDLEDMEFECPECGKAVSGNIDQCPSCGTEFEDEVEEDEE